MKTSPFLSASTAQKATTALPPIKICMHVLGKAPTDARVMRAATALAEKGYAVSIVDIADKATCQNEEDVLGILMKHVMVSRSFLSTRFNKWTLIRSAQLFVRSTRRLLQTPADIYHAHDEATLPACYIAALLRSKPLVFDAHEFPLFQWPLFEMSILRRCLHELLTIFLGIVIPRCASVLTVSPPIVRELRNRYRGAKVSLVRNVPAYRIVPKSDRLRQFLGLSPDIRIALYQGALMHNRSLDKLIYAAPFLEPNIVIVLMGPDDGFTKLQLEDLIVSEGVADRVKIIPAVPYSELLDWTSSADIGLIVLSPNYSPSIRMCLPNKLFEYLMAGLPVLASQLDAVSDILRTYDVGQTVSSLAPADIGAAINALLADPTALSCMRRNALEAAQQDLCWEKENQQLIHVYDEIVGIQNKECL
jgi:glycosyltransferase involved in cell wall biosynthesis